MSVQCKRTYSHIIVCVWLQVAQCGTGRCAVDCVAVCAVGVGDLIQADDAIGFLWRRPGESSGGGGGFHYGQIPRG